MCIRDRAYAARGEIVLVAKPLAGGKTERWFDFHAVSQGGGPVASTRTTAWEFGDQSGALEYYGEVDGEPTTAYARWDEDGGRYDHHLEYDDVDLGPVDEIMTNCWNTAGREEFGAWAVIDQLSNYYGELEGQESACGFGPVADHPDPGEEFDDLPAQGEWELLELLSWCAVSSSC